MRVLRFDGMRVHRHGSVRSGGIESLGRKEPYRTFVVPSTSPGVGDTHKSRS